MFLPNFSQFITEFLHNLVKMPLELSSQTQQLIAEGEEQRIGIFVQDFQVESLDGLYRFVFAGEVPLVCILSFIAQVEYELKAQGQVTQFREASQKKPQQTEVINVDPRVLLFSFVFQDTQKLLKLIKATSSAPAYH